MDTCLSLFTGNRTCRTTRSQKWWARFRTEPAALHFERCPVVRRRSCHATSAFLGRPSQGSIKGRKYAIHEPVDWHFVFVCLITGAVRRVIVADLYSILISICTMCSYRHKRLELPNVTPNATSACCKHSDCITKGAQDPDRCNLLPSSCVITSTCTDKTIAPALAESML